VPPSTPTTIHGRRIPNREVVRSLSLPTNGLPISATSDPIPTTRARAPGARRMPTSALILRVNVMDTGAMRTKLVPRYTAA
jgi:hypothetical protein